MRLSSTGPLLAALAGMMPLLAACDDDVIRTGLPDLLMCANLAEAIAMDTTVVGNGDHLISLGNHSIAVPAEALPEEASVRFVGAQVPGTDVRVIVEVESEVQFESDVTLTLGYGDRQNCTVNGVPVANVTDLRVYNLDRGEPLPEAAAVEGAVAGRTRSFSTFAIAH